MPDFIVLCKNYRLAKIWLKSLMLTIVKSPSLTGIALIFVVLFIAFSSQFFSLCWLQKVANENSLHTTNVSAQREKVHNLYVIDLIDACINSENIDPINRDKYCNKAKEYYMYKAQEYRQLEDSAHEIIENGQFLIMRADIRYLINEQDVKEIGRKYPIKTFPEINFLFTIWFNFLSCFAGLLCAWLFYGSIKKRRFKNEEQT
ncbi:MAG: hypothetical protein CVV11_06225 [Gammaproteobacteria bacterium HGW-Gammaproteobacteria-15]|nr:MAG: hypothetical protein CVV11_06225 [Gammaproteobacteria bacterium HGW-Gammaproteobacteria-15]